MLSHDCHVDIHCGLFFVVMLFIMVFVWYVMLGKTVSLFLIYEAHQALENFCVIVHKTCLLFDTLHCGLSGICLVKQLVCLVIDEAHRATGNYSYCVAVREACFLTPVVILFCTKSF